MVALYLRAISIAGVGLAQPAVGGAVHVNIGDAVLHEATVHMIMAVKGGDYARPLPARIQYNFPQLLAVTDTDVWDRLNWHG